MIKKNKYLILGRKKAECIYILSPSNSMISYIAN